jgi:spore germination cell wall hydrolase CwlJ-like protein
MALDFAIATYTIYCEASGESRQAKLGVAYSEISRWKTGRFGETIAVVCLKRKQYSEWNGDVVNNNNLLRAARCSDTDPSWLECLDVFHAAMAGSEPDPTHGATHYHDTSIDPPDWTIGAIRTAQLGKLIFYRGVR